MNDEYLACRAKKRCFALTIPCAFAKTFKEEKNRIPCGVIFQHVMVIFYRANEIYAWCGQMPYVMSVAACGQRSSHRIPWNTICSTHRACGT